MCGIIGIASNKSVSINIINALNEKFKEKGEHIAAFIAEPIQGEAGVIVPSDNYWKEHKYMCWNYYL